MRGARCKIAYGIGENNQPDVYPSILPGLTTQESYHSSSTKKSDLGYVEQRGFLHQTGFAGTSLDLYFALYRQTHATTMASNKRVVIKIANGMSQSASSISSWNLSSEKRKDILTRVVICKIFSTFYFYSDDPEIQNSNAILSLTFIVMNVMYWSKLVDNMAHSGINPLKIYVKRK